MSGAYQRAVWQGGPPAAPCTCVPPPLCPSSLEPGRAALVEHEIAQPTLQALVHLSLLQLALGNVVVFLLIREKAAKLMKQGGGKRVRESAHYGMGQGYHPLSFRPQAL